MGDKVKKLEYGIATRAWHPVVGCSPHMPCAERCWARKTMARVVECQWDRKDSVFRQALTPDLKQWSGKVLIDDAHLNDPLHWRKPALIATGFHGDVGRISVVNLTRPFAVMAASMQHRFIALTKQPQQFVNWARSLNGHLTYEVTPGVSVSRILPLDNVTIGCSVMNQSEADRQRPAMAALAAMGWHTHCWYEPAIGPVDWKGWEFLELLIVGGESGKDSRPMNPTWARNARDWCAAHGIVYRLKQWGDFCEWNQLPDESARIMDAAGEGGYEGLRRVGKRLAGNLLDGVRHDEMPDWMRV